MRRVRRLMASCSAAVGLGFAVRLKRVQEYSASSSSERMRRGAPRRIISAGSARVLLIGEYLSIAGRGLPSFGSRGFLLHVAALGDGRGLVEEDGGRDLEALAEASDVTASELALASHDDRDDSFAAELGSKHALGEAIPFDELAK